MTIFNVCDWPNVPITSIMLEPCGHKMVMMSSAPPNICLYAAVADWADTYSFHWGSGKPWFRPNPSSSLTKTAMLILGKYVILYKVIILMGCSTQVVTVSWWIQSYSCSGNLYCSFPLLRSNQVAGKAGRGAHSIVIAQVSSINVLWGAT